MPFPKKEKVISRQEAFLKACSFCAYQERLQSDVRTKLKTMKIDLEMAEDIISELIIHNFLNEERYAKAYAGGKFRIKKWGRLKIIRNLEQKGLSSHCIKKGLEEINEEDYMETLRNLLETKKEETKEENLYVEKHKLSTYAIGKGYEPELVWQLLQSSK